MMQVTRFDMLPGIDVYWWGSLGDDIESLLSGQPVSETKLSGLYSNANMEVCLIGFDKKGIPFFCTLFKDAWNCSFF